MAAQPEDKKTNEMFANKIVLEALEVYEAAVKRQANTEKDEDVRAIRNKKLAEIQTAKKDYI